ncbi:TIGR03503 family protein [Marinospirillum celere]|uniref:TIGR03503 family protein n=1 Tax=Marinospirillum celere TaxID=1122252 RepID=A0A1I1E9M6_9GAMM|nr:vWA domain-containing protein [Marinospirillum celere]SFB81710.1 TIGR03503 family protein [Marinospirillum celere]
MKKIFLLLICLNLLIVGKLQAAEQTDVRLVVDISGSMNWTDPNNLRIPATHMLIDLLSEGTQAGIWTFARQVNMLVTHAQVDEAWREGARIEAEKINSVGLYTHIDRAIETVTWDAGWDVDRERHIILLSDGLVDISQAETERERSRENQESRDYLLRERLPRLVEAGYTLHTLALSDEADHDLMATLAQRSGGLHAIAYEAEDLMPLLLQILNRMVDRDQVPLDGDRFSIDSLISEFTVLVFHQEDAEVVLRSPDGEAYTASSSSDQVRWHSNSRYTQITVDEPAAGTWQIETPAHPDNRVTVVSDLKLRTNGFPATVYRGFPDKQQNLQAWFTEEGQRVDRREFLRLLNAEIRHHQGDLLLTEQSMSFNEGSYDFRGSLTEFTELGEQQVTILVDGNTFQRQVRHSFNVQDVVAAYLQLPEDGGIPRVILRAQHPELDPAEVGFTVSANAAAQPVRYRGDGEWVVDLRNLEPDQDYEIEVEVEGELRGERLSVELPPLFLEAGSLRTLDRQVEELTEELPAFVQPIEPRLLPPVLPLPEQPVTEVRPTEAPTPEPLEPMPEPEPQAEPEPQPEAEASERSLFELDFSPIRSWDDPRMLWVYVALGIANILLFAFAFIMYRGFVKRRQRRHDAREHDDEEGPEIDDLEFDLDDELETDLQR